MRTKTIVAMAVLASVTLVGCNNDNELEVDRVKDTPMTFVTNVNQPATRAGYEKGELPTDAIFGLTITTPGGETDLRFTQQNKKMTYVTNKWMDEAETTPLLWKSSETTVDYTAYVPYSAEAVNADGTFKTAYPVTVPADQTTAAAIKAADFLYTSGTAKGSASTAGIPLAFKHMLSQLKVTLKRGSELADGVTFTSVVLAEDCAALSTTIDLTTGAVTPAAPVQTAESVMMLGNTEKTEFECILVPQTFATAIVILTSDGNGYVYYSTEELPFASGKTYTLPLTVGRDRVEAGTITAAPWTETPGGDLETE